MVNTNAESTTALDNLYNLLLERKMMSVESIATHFNVSKDLVMEWGKILEAGELATIENPKIGKPSIKLAGYAGEAPKEEDNEEALKRKGIEMRENIIQTNRLIKNRNEGKIKEAKKIITTARQNGFNDESIKQKFIERGWPTMVIEGLLK